MEKNVYSNYRDRIAVPKDVFDRLHKAKEEINNEINKGVLGGIKTATLDIVESFTLYYVFHVRKDRRAGDVEIQMERLIKKYFGNVRSETYLSINRYILLLERAGLIKTTGDYYTGKQIICATVIPVEKPYKLIACVNEDLIKRSETGKANIPFALHCLLTLYRVHDDNIWEEVEIDQTTLSAKLGVHIESVRDAIEELHKGGFITRTPPQYFTTDDGKARSHTLLYTIHDYDSPVDNTKTIKGIEQQKVARQSKKMSKTILKELLQDFTQTPILLIGEYAKALDDLREKDNDIKHKLFNTHELKNGHEVRSFIEKYNNIQLDNDMFLIIELPNPTVLMQMKLLKFIENNDKLPLVIVATTDRFIAPFLSRIKCCLKKSTIKAHSLNFVPIHKGYQQYEKKYKFYSKNVLIDHAFYNCPEMLPSIITNENEDIASYRVDNLISKLTGGKTYTDVLHTLPDVSDDVKIETKLLSLCMKRVDLAQLLTTENMQVINNSMEVNT